MQLNGMMVAMDSSGSGSSGEAATAGEAARQLRAMLDALPPTSARDRATARRLEGAAVALQAQAQQR